MVGANGVVLDRVVGRAGGSELDAVHRVELDRVAGTGGRAADGVVRRPGVDLDAVAGVAQGIGTSQRRADGVPRDDVVLGAGSCDLDAIPTVRRDDIARRPCSRRPSP